MIAFLSALSLKLKLWGLAALGVLATFALFWFRWKLAAARADKAEQQAAALTATRKVEMSIQKGRTKLREKQAKLREEIAADKDRNVFEDQGWGP